VDTAIRVVIPLLLGALLFVPFVNVRRRRAGVPPLRGGEAWRAGLKFAAIFVPLGALFILGVETLYE
jgi:hypothetical protein